MSPTTAVLRRAITSPAGVLVAITMVWGVTFVIVRAAMQQAAPMGFVGLRFAAAALLLAALGGPRRMAGITRTELAAGAAIGGTIALGYGLQSAGLQTITASASAFITALYVPAVPLLQWLVLGRPPRTAAWAGIALASVGLILMTAPGAGGIGLGAGEAMTVAAAIAIAAEVVLIGRWAGRVDMIRVTVLQMGFAAAFALVAAVLRGEAAPAPGIIGIAAAMGCASAAIQLGMNWAQRSLSPTRATLIYAGEPVWAGLAGRLAGERLGPVAIAGGALILAGVLVGEGLVRLPARRGRAGRARG